jgi:NAD(P)-dependent dehydrogenase (short-subunit alcohol dehydrogenase family)
MEPSGIALVTGASRGIGRATAMELAHRGFQVIASMRNPSDGEELASAARQAGVDLEIARLDVTAANEWKAPGGLRVLVNNAAVELENHAIEHTSLDDWRHIFETNVFGLVEVTRRAIPSLRRAGGGVICNITSCSTLVPMPFFAVYRASKAAISALGESLRTELAAFGIRVVEIMPGAIETEMLAASPLLPEGAERPGYAELGERVRSNRALAAGATTPPSEAARRIVDAIVCDDAPLRNACDPMGSGLLDDWRAKSDEEAMQPMLALFAPER